LRQLARSICRKPGGQGDDADEVTQPLFEDQLQPRYPAIREGEEAYVLRANLTLAERRANSARLRLEAASKARHADALDAETEQLLADGYFKDAA
jgi:hypothetical protein